MALYLVASPHCAASWFSYGADERPITWLYEWFSMKIQITCAYVAGGLDLVPHGPAGVGWAGPLRTMMRGARPPSRLTSRTARDAEIDRLSVPLPCTSRVTSSVVQAPAAPTT